MPNKTIYVADAELWLKAKEIASDEGESLSGILEAKLRLYVEEKEKEKATLKGTMIVHGKEVEFTYIKFTTLFAAINHFGKVKTLEILNNHLKFIARSDAYASR